MLVKLSLPASTPTTQTKAGLHSTNTLRLPIHDHSLPAISSLLVCPPEEPKKVLFKFKEQVEKKWGDDKKWGRKLQKKGECSLHSMLGQLGLEP
jgi:hypothetical protein